MNTMPFDPDDVPEDDVDPTCANPDDDVMLQLSSMQNVSYRHIVSTGVSRAEWLGMTLGERSDVTAETVLRYVEVAGLNDPHDEQD